MGAVITARLTNINGHLLTTQTALECTINRHRHEAAATLNILLPFVRTTALAVRVQVLEGGVTLFSGQIDRVETIRDQRGAFLRLRARTRGAILADNECHPDGSTGDEWMNEYQRAIQARFNINFVERHNEYMRDRIRLNIGTSEWEKMRILNWSALGVFPMFTEEDLIWNVPTLSSNTITFNDTFGNNRYVQIEHFDRRENLLSRVATLQEGQNFGRFVDVASDSIASNELNIDRVRNMAFRNFGHFSGGLSAVRRAQQEIRRRRSGAFGYIVRVPGNFAIRNLQRVRINDSALGDLQNLFVGRYSHILNKDGRFTEIEVWPTRDF